MKIVTVIGARPQFIKACALSRAIQNRPTIEELIIHTGQHFDANLSDVFFEEMGIPSPHVNLGISAKNHGAMTGQMMEKIEEILLQEKPDWILVYGDTNSTLAAALAAAKLNIPLAHVEAGLRSFNRAMPEEINRILTDHASTLLFTPTSRASEQLQKEGISPQKIVQVGDVMHDVALFFKDRAKKLDLPKEYALATIHRAENTDDAARLTEIFAGLITLAKTCSIVIPLHPRTRLSLDREGLLSNVLEALHVLEPVSYLEMIALERDAQVILTDSGGVQKEAYFFQVPCLTLRTETEWEELVEYEYNRLVPLYREVIVEAFHQALKAPYPPYKSLYGEGNAALKILQVLEGGGKFGQAQV